MSIPLGGLAKAAAVPKTMCDAQSVSLHRCRPCPADTPLYDMLKLFEIGRSHMAVLMQLRKEAKERQRKLT